MFAHIVLLSCSSAVASRTLCRVSYAPQHSYSSLDLSAERIATHDTWYINGDGGGSSLSIATFIGQTESTTRAILEKYVVSGGGKAIIGGLQTTNLLILDIEGAVPLKKLGLWLAASRANPKNTTFIDIVAAYKQRVSVARSLFPRAEIALYGSPAQPMSFPGENSTLAVEGYVAAAAEGIFDEVSYLVAVQYFGMNASEGGHHDNVFGDVNKTSALWHLRTSARRGCLYSCLYIALSPPRAPSRCGTSARRVRSRPMSAPLPFHVSLPRSFVLSLSRSGPRAAFEALDGGSDPDRREHEADVQRRTTRPAVLRLARALNDSRAPTAMVRGAARRTHRLVVLPG